MLVKGELSITRLGRSWGLSTGCTTCNTRRMTSKREQQEAAGRWLRDTREQRGYATAAELARRLAVSPALISRYETGLSAVSDDRAEQIAEALGMDLMEVRRGLGLWVPPPDSRPDSELRSDLRDQLRRLRDAMDRELDDRNRPVYESLIGGLEAVVEQSRKNDA